MAGIKTCECTDAGPVHLMFPDVQTVPPLSFACAGALQHSRRRWGKQQVISLFPPLVFVSIEARYTFPNKEKDHDCRKHTAASNAGGPGR